jgi:hypothetical protein
MSSSVAAGAEESDRRAVRCGDGGGGAVVAQGQPLVGQPAEGALGDPMLSAQAVYNAAGRCRKRS